MRRIRAIAVAAGLAVAVPWAAAALEKVITFDFAPVRKLVQDRCLSCHEWAADPQGLVERVVPGDPEASLLWQMVSSDAMPADGPLADAEKELLEAWITAGAPTEEAAEEAADPIARSPDAVGLRARAFSTRGTLTLSRLILGAPDTTLPTNGSHRSTVAIGVAQSAVAAAIPRRRPARASP